MATPEELRRFKNGPTNPQEHIWWNKYSHKNLKKWRYIQDPLADACTEKIDLRRNPTRLLEQVEEEAQRQGGCFQAFLDFYDPANVPGWVNFEKMETGRRFYRRYQPLQGLVLMCSSLIEGYAHAKPAQVLVATGRLNQDVSRRIFETGQMLHNMQADSGLRPGSVGVRTIMQVRLLHSAVRQWLKSSSNWDNNKWDLPINQEDMSMTTLGFDLMVVRGMEKLGLKITRDEHISMHYFWRYAGYLLGVDEALLPSSIEEQEILALHLTTHLYAPTPDGEKLAKSLLRDMSNLPGSLFNYDYLLAVSGYLGGPVLRRDFHLKSRVSSGAAVFLTRKMVGLSNRPVRLLPDIALQGIEHFNFRVARGAIKEGLGGDPADFGFKVIA